MTYFPFLMNPENRKCLVVGSGHIALNKIRLLDEFGADVTCISKDACEEEHCTYISKAFEDSDLDEEWFAVIAATDDHELNHHIACLCKEKGIPVNAVDQKEDCTFIFPAIIHHKDVVAAFSSGGRNPVITQYMKEACKDVINERLGDINEETGKIRDRLMDLSPKERKAVMREILERCLHDEDYSDILEEFHICISE